MNKAKRNKTTKTERRAQTDKRKNSAVNNDRCKVCTRFKIGF